MHLNKRKNLHLGIVNNRALSRPSEKKPLIKIITISSKGGKRLEQHGVNI